VSRSAGRNSARALLALAVASALLVGCYLKPILVETGKGETLLVVSVLDPETNETGFNVYSASGGDLSKWEHLGWFSGKAAAATWCADRLWVFHGRDASAYGRTEDGLEQQTIKLNLEWEVIGDATAGPDAVWCAGIREGRVVALRLSGAAAAETFDGPKVSEGPHAVSCAWLDGSLVVAWRVVGRTGPDPEKISVAALAAGAWSEAETIEAPRGRIALVASSGEGLSMLVLGKRAITAGGSVLFEAARSEAGWSDFAPIAGTETTYNFGFISLSAVDTSEGVACVRTNTQKLEFLRKLPGGWQVVESPEGLPEGHAQLYVGAMLLLAAGLVLAGLFSFFRWYRGAAAPAAPPGWATVAPMSRRGLAYSVDFLVAVPMTLLVLGAFGVDLPMLAASPLLQVIAYLVPLSYFVLAEAIGGATLGKRLMGIRVVMADGSKLTVLGSLVRNLFRLLDELPPMSLIPVVGLVVSSITRRRQRIGDLFARTVVVGTERLGAERSRKETG